MIPHTGSETTLLQKRAGDAVNLENDVVGKYVERLMNFNTDKNAPPLDGKDKNAKPSLLTLEYLEQNGF